MTLRYPFALLILYCLQLCAISDVNAQTQETEPNDNLNAAGVQTIQANGIFRGSFTQSDLDYYKIAPASGTLKIDYDIAPINGLGIWLHEDGKSTPVASGLFPTSFTYALDPAKSYYILLATGTATGNWQFTVSGANFIPQFSKLGGDAVAWAGVGNTVLLDQGADAEINSSTYDATNYNGTALTLQRKGTALSGDLFGFNDNTSFSVSGTKLLAAGLEFASFNNSGGKLTIYFNGAQLPVSKLLVQAVLRNLTYGNDSPVGNATIVFSLGNGYGNAESRAEVTVTANDIYLTSVSDDPAINPADGVGFREAVAISAGQSGTQTIHLSASSMANANIVLGSSLSINKETKLRYGPNKPTISGSTITISAGSALVIEAGTGILTFNNNLTGAGTVSSTASGSIYLGGNNSNLGKLVAASGLVSINSPDQLPNTGMELDGATLSFSEAMNLDRPLLIKNSATLDSDPNVTIEGVISGNGTLIKTGGGTLTFTAANTFSGKLDIRGGNVSASSAANLPFSTIRMSYGGLNASQSFSLDAQLELEIYAPITVNTGMTLTLNGDISGSGNFTKFMLGTLVLKGNSTHTGYLVLSQGNLSISKTANLPLGKLLLSGGSLSTTAATTISNEIELNANATLSTAGDLNLSGSINGNYNLHRKGLGTLTLSGINGFGTLSFTGDVSVADRFNLPLGAIHMNNGSSLAIAAGEISNNINLVGGSSSIYVSTTVRLKGNVTQSSNNSGFIKTGPGTLTITGTTSNTGAISVKAGKLVVNGSLTAFRSLVVQAGATLSGTGNIFTAGTAAATVVVEPTGVIEPGAALTINGHMDMAPGSIFRSAIVGNENNGSLKVSGICTLDNPLLEVNHLYTPGSLDTYTLIEMTSNARISGGFNGLVQDGTIIASGNNTKLTASYTGGNGNDFTLRAPAITLPVELVSFTVKNENTAVRLEWKTGSESDHKSFTVLRSRDGNAFSTIATIPSISNSAAMGIYYHYDRLPLPGRSYYQLVQTDLNGKKTELGIRSVDFSMNKEELLTLAPNPADNYTKVAYPFGTVSLEMIDLHGKVLKSIPTAPGSIQQEIQLEGLAPGTYLLRGHGSYGTITTKLLKSEVR